MQSEIYNEPQDEELDDGQVEIYTIAQPFESWEHYVADLQRNRFRWDERPNCIDIDMYPTRARQQVVLAQDICVGCPVQKDCLYVALVSKEEYGVWGGTTESERSEIIGKLNLVLGNYSRWWKPEYEEEITHTVEQFIVSHKATYGTQTA